MAPTYDVLAPFHDRLERDEALATLRRDDPVHWDADNDWWLLTRHAEVREVSRDPDLFSSEPKGPGHAIEAHFSMQAMDGDPHKRQRGIVSRAFTPRMVAGLGERARRYADEAIDAIGDRRDGDFVTDLAVPVPMRIIADMLGVGEERLDDFRRWTDAMALAGGGHGTEEDQTRLAEAVAEFHRYLAEEVEERRAGRGSGSGEDLLSKIIAADDEGAIDFRGDHEQMGSNDLANFSDRDRLDSSEITDFAIFLLIAGNETTRNAISQGMRAFFEFPEQRERLTAEPKLWETAAGEILRWTAPVRAMRRVAMRDTMLGGKRIREGESVVMVYASANRDEAVFEAPHEFRVDRDPNDFLSFGFGTHYCLGANLARLEIRATLARIFERLPNIRLAAGAKPTEMPNALLDGLDELPVEYGTFSPSLRPKGR